MIKDNTIQKWIDILLLSAMFLFPFTVNIAYISPEDIGHPILSLNISISDLLIGITFLFWIINVIIFKSFKDIRYPPFPVLILLFIGGLSLIRASSILDWVKDFVQLVEYLFLFYLLLLNNLKAIKFRFILELLLLQASLVVVTAFIQYSILDGSPYLVRGLFENRNLMGAYLCIILPFVFTHFFSTSSVLKKVWMVILVILSVLIILSGIAAISLIISLLVIGIMQGKKVFVRVVIALIIAGCIYPIIMPQKNKEALLSTLSLYERGSISKNYYRRLTILTHLDKKVLLKKNIDINYISISSNLFMSSKMPEIQEGDAYKYEEKKKHIKNFYLEMLACMNLISENTLIGVGLGNFQSEISTYYKGFQKINTSEPYVHNGYLLIGATTGILGLSGFIWILSSFLNKSVVRFRSLSKNNEFRSCIALGCIGSIVSIIIQNFFVSILTAALLPLFIIILYSIDNEIEL